MLIDERFIQFAGMRLDRFSVKQRRRYACRCPLCGDSATDLKKVRGNFFVHSGHWIYKCFNCGQSRSVGSFLREVFPDLYDDYIFAGAQQKYKSKAPMEQEEPAAEPDPGGGGAILTDLPLPKLSDLSMEHPAVSYMADRKLPTKYFHDLYYSESFKTFANSIVPDAFENTLYDQPRVVIPFRDRDGAIFAFQGRALDDNSKVKYLTVKINKEKHKIYGIDKVNPEEVIYVVEGPIDSMFVQNSIAVGDAGLDSVLNVHHGLTFLQNSKLVFVWDNESRSKQIVSMIERAIDSGLSVVIWAKSHKFKDINNAVQKHGFTIESINELIRKRTFSGLTALAELNNWRKDNKQQQKWSR